MASAEIMESPAGMESELSHQAVECKDTPFTVQTHHSTTQHKVHSLVPTAGGREVMNLVDYITIDRNPVARVHKDARGKMQTIMAGTRIWMKAAVASSGRNDSAFIRHATILPGEDVDAAEARMFAELEEAIRNQA